MITGTWEGCFPWPDRIVSDCSAAMTPWSYPLVRYPPTIPNPKLKLHDPYTGTEDASVTSLVASSYSKKRPSLSLKKKGKQYH